jgi:hypothetical protein
MFGRVVWEGVGFKWSEVKGREVKLT